MNVPKKCVKCIITGKVQGVWFRAKTKHKADELGVTGWVRNLNTGQVETQACGTAEQLEEFIAWLHKGPPAAKVDRVEVMAVDCEKFIKFKVRYGS